MKLYYRKNLTSLARRLRKAGILSEALLWEELRQNKLGVRFLRQRPIGGYIVDFYCHKLALVLEIDGAATHDNRITEDTKRQKELESLGITFLRIRDADVQFNLNSAIEAIKNEIFHLRKRE